MIILEFSENRLFGILSIRKKVEKEYFTLHLRAKSQGHVQALCESFHLRESWRLI